MINIISDTEFLLDDFNPYAIARGIALQMKERRLELNLTQELLASQSGVSLGTLKRFENSYEISLKHLLMLAVVLDSTGEFFGLFTKRNYGNIEEVLRVKAAKKRQRGRRNV